MDTSKQNINEQEILLSIVETWRPSKYPEYRGFRCANCQQYKNKAWYHWVNFGNYRLPIHMCNDTCEKEFNNGTIKIDASKRQTVDRDKFGDEYKFSEKAIKRFEEIVSLWPSYEEPKLKVYTCDHCGNDLDIDPIDGQRKGYHVWWKQNDGKTLIELHFHKDCGHKLDIYSKEEKS